MQVRYVCHSVYGGIVVREQSLCVARQVIVRRLTCNTFLRVLERSTFLQASGITRAVDRFSRTGGQRLFFERTST